MAEDKIIQQIKNDFPEVEKNKKVLAILLYGSHAADDATPRSDIDICVVAPKTDPAEILREVWRNVPIGIRKYDVYIFEEMPLYLKMEVINNHKVIFTRNIYDLHEYFYFFRKLWNDQKHRQEVSKEEVLAMLG